MSSFDTSGGNADAWQIKPGEPRRLAEIDGELLGVAENHRAFEAPEEPHGLEANGYTRIKNQLFRMARDVERE